jgi:hypothetical protein
MVEVDETDVVDDSPIDVVGAWFPAQAVNTRSATHRRIPLTVLSRTAYQARTCVSNPAMTEAL